MTLGPGTYYVGDLCYVFEDDDWDVVCSKSFDPMNGSSMEGVFNMTGDRKFALFGTAYGDGEYYDQFNNRYLVDSGTIGCVMVRHATRKDMLDMKFFGNVVEFKEPFDVSKEGTSIMIGHLFIETGDEVEEDYDEEVFNDWDNDR